MMDYKEKYGEYLKQVENRLDEYVQEIAPKTLYEPFKYIISGGGKRIRPVLTMICAGAVGGRPEDAVDCGTALEILHNFTLVHDDIMDDSPIRRGKTTIHEKWDRDVAILTGDVMVGWAYQILPGPEKHERSGSIYKAFTRGLIEVCEGQAYDTDFDNDDDVKLEDYLLMIDKKTAKLLETAALMGGHAGNGSEEEIETLRKYANAVGIAFQIQDDLLDLTADQAKLGKRIGQDIIEGKKTFLILKAMEFAKTDKHKALLKKFYDNHGLAEEYIEPMKNMLDSLGILELAQNEVDRYFDIASSELDKLKQNDSVAGLRWLIKKLNKRNY